MSSILDQGQGINHMPLVGCGQKLKKKFSVEHPLTLGRWGGSATAESWAAGGSEWASHLRPGFCRKACRLCWSEASGGKSRPGPSPWLYPCPRPLAGTRIIYDRKFLMECRNSPVTKTPPRDLPTIPGVTSPTGDEPPTEARQNHLRSSPEDKPAGGEWPGTAGLSLQEAEERAWEWVFREHEDAPAPWSSTQGEGRVWGAALSSEPTFPRKGAQEAQARPFSLIR